MININKEFLLSVNSGIGVSGHLNAMPTPEFRKFELHWHDMMELMLIIRGAMVLNLDGVQHIATEHQLIIVPPRSLHEGSPDKCGVQFYTIFIHINRLFNDTELTEEILKPLANGEFSFDHITECEDAIRKTNELIESLEAKSKIRILGRTYELIDSLLENCCLQKGQKRLPFKLQSVYEYIEQHFQEPISTRDISNEFGYTNSYLCRLFKDNTGMTISQYIQSYRIEQSKKLLQRTSQRINEVALNCGFIDFNYFCRCFKKHVMMTPSEFRANFMLLEKK